MMRASSDERPSAPESAPLDFQKEIAEKEDACPKAITAFA